MKRRSLIFLFTCLLVQKLVSGQDKISVQKTPDAIELTCKDGKWKPEIETSNKLLKYEDEIDKTYDCEDDKDSTIVNRITVRFRSCDNCIELDAPALSAIIVGNLVATFLIACAVYSITRQPKGRNFTGNKASDKVNLLTNGEGDTYQQLTPGQNSEYSRLEGVRKK